MTESDRKSDQETRQLGVVEAFTVVVKQCPNGSVRHCAEQALEAVKRGGADTLREQAYFVLTAMRGWRGEKASQVHASLSSFLEQGGERGRASETKGPANTALDKERGDDEDR